MLQNKIKMYLGPVSYQKSFEIIKTIWIMDLIPPTVNLDLSIYCIFKS